MSEGIRQGDIPGVQLRCRTMLDIPVTAAWAWITEVDKLERWLATRIELTGGTQGRVALHHRAADGTLWNEEGKTLEVDPPRRWVLAFRRVDESWPVATRLSFQLSERADGCELSLLQEGFEHLPLSDCLTIWERYRRFWRAALADLAKACSDRPG